VVVVVDVQQSVFRLGDDRNFQVVARRDEFIASLASEDVFGDKVALGVAVLAGFGRGNIDDLFKERERRVSTSSRKEKIERAFSEHICAKSND
jgi:hypothetical protein